MRLFVKVMFIIGLVCAILPYLVERVLISVVLAVSDLLMVVGNWF